MKVKCAGNMCINHCHVLWYKSFSFFFIDGVITSKNVSHYSCYSCDGTCEKMSVCDNAIVVNINSVFFILSNNSGVLFNI